MKAVKWVLSFVVAACLCMSAVTTVAASSKATPNPVVGLRGAADKLIATLKSNKVDLKTNPDEAYKIVDRILLPHIDINSMARYAMGRQGWMKATAVQRKEFTQEFVTLVVRTYSTALANYKDQTIKFLSPRTGYKGKKRILLKSVIEQPHSGQPISVNYRMVLKNGKWLVYDFSVEGISMVQSFQNQFSSILQGGGVDKLLVVLKQHNGKNSKGGA